jgi:integrase
VVRRKEIKLGTTVKRTSSVGSIRQRPDGRYEGRFSINGIRKSVYAPSHAECERKIKKFLKDTERGKINPKTDSLYEYASKWIVEYKLDELEPSSYDRLETMINTQISNSKLSKEQFGKITSNQFKEFFNDMISPKDKNQRAYSYSTTKRVYELLKNMYKMAHNNGDITYNPMAEVKLPKQSKCITETKETFSLSPSEIQSLKEACLQKTNNNLLYKYRYGLIYMLMLNLGLRVGEMLALQWDDIDTEKKFLKINKAVQSNVKNREGKGNKRTFNVTQPKTKNAVRLIPLNEEVEFLLNEIKLDNCRRGIISDLVCCSSTGGYATARNLQRSFDIVVENSDLEKHLWLHLLRHTFGSELIRKGVDISVVSKLMGHGDIYTTYTKYIHAIEEETVKAMNLNSVSGK